MTAARRGEKPDYGLDAPGVVRNLCLAGGAGILIWALGAAGAIPNGLTLGPVRIELGLAPLCVGVGMLGVGLWMLWSSKVGKIRYREKLLDHHAWQGDEHVLDVGCGRGLMLVGSAKRLTTGTATGIDIWQAEDLSGNEPGAPLENARREGVGDRVTVQTENGQWRSYDVAATGELRVGDRVRIENNVLFRS